MSNMTDFGLKGPVREGEPVRFDIWEDSNGGSWTLKERLVDYWDGVLWAGGDLAKALVGRRVR